MVEQKGKRLTITANTYTKIDQQRTPPVVAVRMRKFRPLRTLHEPIRLHDLLNFARSRADKKIKWSIDRNIKDVLKAMVFQGIGSASARPEQVAYGLPNVS